MNLLKEIKDIGNEYFEGEFEDMFRCILKFIY